MIDLVEFFSVGVRIFATSLWAMFINRTIIIRTQKRTRNRLQHIIIVLIISQILLIELRRFQAKQRRKSFDNFLGKKRTGSFATIRARKTIDSLNNFLVHLQHFSV